jgi:hypothetical protein
MKGGNKTHIAVSKILKSRNTSQILAKSIKERSYLGDVDVDGEIILKRAFKIMMQIYGPASLVQHRV